MDAILDRALTVPTDLPFTSAPVGSRWFALEDTAGFTTRDAFIIELGGIAEACGMRVVVGRSSGLAPIQVVASESDVRTLPVRLDPRCERACAFADAVHLMEEHSLDDFSIQGLRPRHWLLLEHWLRQAMGLSSSVPGVDEHHFLCEMLGHGTQFDQLNLRDLSLGEAVSRRLQLWEAQ